MPISKCFSLQRGAYDARVRKGNEASVCDALKDLYGEKILPLEKHYAYEDFNSTPLEPAYFDSKPVVLLFGEYSTGKTSFIKYILGKEYPGMRIGPEPTTDNFIIVEHGDEDGVVPGNALVVDKNKQYGSLAKFGGQFLNKFQCSTVNSPILEKVTFVDTPGILSGEKERGYNLTAVLRWFAERCDRIILLFDINKLDISDELKSAIDVLRGLDDKIRIVLNKCDTVTSQQLMRVYGALMWSLGKVMTTPEAARVYIGSFWENPWKNDENRVLFEDEEADMFVDIYTLSRDSEMRKLNDLVRRAKTVRIHGYLMAELKQQMPMLGIGKASRKKHLLIKLPEILDKLSKEHHIPPGDFPPIKELRKTLAEYNWNKIKPRKKKYFQKIEDVLNNDIGKLVPLLPVQEEDSNLRQLERELILNKVWTEKMLQRRPNQTRGFTTSVYTVSTDKLSDSSGVESITDHKQYQKFTTATTSRVISSKAPLAVKDDLTSMGSSTTSTGTTSTLRSAPSTLKRQAPSPKVETKTFIQKTESHTTPEGTTIIKTQTTCLPGETEVTTTETKIVDGKREVIETSEVLPTSSLSYSQLSDPLYATITKKKEEVEVPPKLEDVKNESTVVLKSEVREFVKDGSDMPDLEEYEKIGETTIEKVETTIQEKTTVIQNTITESIEPIITEIEEYKDINVTEEEKELNIDPKKTQRTKDDGVSFNVEEKTDKSSVESIEALPDEIPNMLDSLKNEEDISQVINIQPLTEEEIERQLQELMDETIHLHLEDNSPPSEESAANETSKPKVKKPAPKWIEESAPQILQKPFTPTKFTPKRQFQVKEDYIDFHIGEKQPQKTASTTQKTLESSKCTPKKIQELKEEENVEKIIKEPFVPTKFVPTRQFQVKEDYIDFHIGESQPRKPGSQTSSKTTSKSKRSAPKMTEESRPVVLQKPFTPTKFTPTRQFQVKEDYIDFHLGEQPPRKIKPQQTTGGAIPSSSKSKKKAFIEEDRGPVILQKPFTPTKFTPTRQFQVKEDYIDFHIGEQAPKQTSTQKMTQGAGKPKAKRSAPKMVEESAPVVLQKPFTPTKFTPTRQFQVKEDYIDFHLGETQPRKVVGQKAVDTAAPNGAPKKNRGFIEEDRGPVVLQKPFTPTKFTPTRQFQVKEDYIDFHLGETQPRKTTAQSTSATRAVPKKSTKSFLEEDRGPVVLQKPFTPTKFTPTRQFQVKEDYIDFHIGEKTPKKTTAQSTNSDPTKGDAGKRKKKTFVEEDRGPVVLQKPFTPTKFTPTRQFQVKEDYIDFHIGEKTPTKTAGQTSSAAGNVDKPRSKRAAPKMAEESAPVVLQKPFTPTKFTPTRQFQVKEDYIDFHIGEKQPKKTPAQTTSASSGKAPPKKSKKYIEDEQKPVVLQKPFTPTKFTPTRQFQVKEDYIDFHIGETQPKKTASQTTSATSTKAPPRKSKKYIEDEQKPVVLQKPFTPTKFTPTRQFQVKEDYIDFHIGENKPLKSTKTTATGMTSQKGTISAARPIKSSYDKYEKPEETVKVLQKPFTPTKFTPTRQFQVKEDYIDFHIGEKQPPRRAAPPPPPQKREEKIMNLPPESIAVKEVITSTPVSSSRTVTTKTTETVRTTPMPSGLTKEEQRRLFLFDTTVVPSETSVIIRELMEGYDQSSIKDYDGLINDDF